MAGTAAAVQGPEVAAAAGSLFEQRRHEAAEAAEPEVIALRLVRSLRGVDPLLLGEVLYRVNCDEPIRHLIDTRSEADGKLEFYRVTAEVGGV